MTEQHTSRRTPATDDNPGVVVHPPILYLAGILAGLGLDAIVAAPVLPAAWQYGIGGPLIAIGVALTLGGVGLFRSAGTNVPTNLPSKALVTRGLYVYSRNPIYVGLSLLYAGIGIAVDTLWILGFLAPILIVMRYGVIAREERYLEARFGGDYRRFKARVRRWF